MDAFIVREWNGGILDSYESFHGTIIAKDNQEIATIEYKSTPEGCKLSIRIDKDSIELSSSCRHLTGNTGKILVNGEDFGHYDYRFLLHALSLFDKKGKAIVQVEDDSTDRRFLWAYRQGATWEESNKYARPEYALLVGENYVLASVVKPLYETLYKMKESKYSIMNDSDEYIFQQRKREEKLCILICACWWLCDSRHPAKSYLKDGWINANRVSIPSYEIIGNRLVVSPHHLAVRNRGKEFWATHPVLMWVWLVCTFSISFIFLPAYEGTFNADNFAFLVYSSIIPAIWILVCFLLNKGAVKRLDNIEERLNRKSV